MAPRTTTDDTPTVEARASVRYLPVSPTKVRPVLDLVRGRAVDDAERMLQLTARNAAGDILKVLGSAIANAQHNFSLPSEELVVSRCWCDEGPTRGGGRARARGRYFRIRKRTSHITIVLTRLSEGELEVRRAKAESSPARAGSTRRRAERVRASRRAAQATEPDHDHDHEHDHGADVEETGDATELETIADDHERAAAAMGEETGAAIADTAAIADATELGEVAAGGERTDADGDLATDPGAGDPPTDPGAGEERSE